MYYTRAILALYLAVGAQALTYWVGPECAGKNFDEAVMDEVRKMGTESSGRLKDDANENMAYSFKTIFKVDRTDEGAKNKALSEYLISNLSACLLDRADMQQLPSTPSPR